jgi:hypothetical protein
MPTASPTPPRPYQRYFDLLDDASPLVSRHEQLELAAVLLGLLPRAHAVLRNGLFAREHAPGGCFVVSGRDLPRADDLVDRGYLTLADATRVKDVRSLGFAFVLEDAGWQRLLADAHDAQVRLFGDSNIHYSVDN